MSPQIQMERPDTPEALALIDELETHLTSLYPQESRHGYSVEKLLRTGVAFFVVRDETGAAVGCGGVQLFGTEYGELKRMYMRPAFRGRGFARQLLDRLAAHARAHGVSLLRLETGVHQHAAIRLYEAFGFRDIPPFGDYRPDPLSRFFEMRLG